MIFLDSLEESSYSLGPGALTDHLIIAVTVNTTTRMSQPIRNYLIIQSMILLSRITTSGSPEQKIVRQYLSKYSYHSNHSDHSLWLPNVSGFVVVFDIPSAVAATCIL
jgi:hypothetical protein